MQVRLILTPYPRVKVVFADDAVLAPSVAEGHDGFHHRREPLRIDDHKIGEIAETIIEMDHRAHVVEEANHLGELLFIDTTFPTLYMGDRT